MLIYNNVKHDLLPASSCALGMFDGVHLGHRAVLDNARQAARENDIPFVIVSFANHPQFVTAHTPTPLLTTLDDRLQMFEELNVDVAIILNFDTEFAKVSAEEYISEILVDALHARFITIGYDHHFGKNKKGNEFLLKDLAGVYNYQVRVIPPISIDGQIVSSSIIRKMLKYGDITIANKLLGREFMLKGQVGKGVQRGRELGYPTANIKPKSNLIIPACGVYSVDISIGKEPEKFPAVLNIGFRPTFADRHLPVLEAYILDFSKDIYNEHVCLYFKEKIRNEKKFESPLELIEQIKKDVESLRVKNQLTAIMHHG